MMKNTTQTYYLRCNRQDSGEIIAALSWQEIRGPKWIKLRTHATLYPTTKLLLHQMVHDHIFVVEAKSALWDSAIDQSQVLARAIRLVRKVHWEQPHARTLAERCLQQILPVWAHYEQRDRKVSRIMRILDKVNSGQWYEETLGLAQTAAVKFKDSEARQPQSLITNAIYLAVAADVKQHVDQIATNCASIAASHAVGERLPPLDYNPEWEQAYQNYRDEQVQALDDLIVGNHTVPEPLSRNRVPNAEKLTQAADSRWLQ